MRFGKLVSVLGWSGESALKARDSPHWP